jgi:chromosome segregation protein
MAYPIGLDPGAVWMKCDFQIHSPRDPNWNGEKFAGGGPQDEAKRQKWANDFIDACIDRDLSAVAITDHHDFTFITYVQRSIKERSLQGKLILFPGMEITCNDSSQCLVLFDPITDETLWDQMFGFLPQIKKSDCNSQSCGPTELCGLDIDDLLRELARNKVFEDKYIALPNGSGEGVHKTVLRDGFHLRFAGLPADGVYSDHAFSAYKKGDLRIIRGEIEEWGTRRRGILPTGDNRSGNFEKLGANPCWIKLGEATTEGIRQALLADDSRIRYDPPIYPAHRITGVTISSNLTGVMKLALNDGFNSIIGGRGSGKSALLEYIRFGLGRSSLDVGRGQERARERELLESTLGGGFVSLDLNRNGVLETWKRDGTSKSITVQVLGSPDEIISVEDAQQRFKARAFSQKQLSSLIRTAEDAADQITGIAAVKSLDRRLEIAQEIAELQRAVQRNVSSLVDFWTAESLNDSATKSVADLKRRIATTKAELETQGLSKEQSAILERAPIFNLAGALLPEAAEAIQADLKATKSISAAIPSIDLSRRDDLKDFPELTLFYEQVDTAKASIQVHLVAVEVELEALLSAQVTAAAKFEAAAAGFKEQHAAASSGQAKFADLIAESNALARELQETETKQRQTKVHVETLSSAPEQLKLSRERLVSARQRMRGLLAEAAIEVSGMSSGLLRAKVETEKEPRELVEALESLCEQANVKESSTRCKDRAAAIMKGDFGQNWEKVVGGSLALLKEKTRKPQGQPVQISAESRKLLKEILFDLTDLQAIRVVGGIDSAKIGRLLGACPNDFIEFEYRDGTKYIPFSQASQGQQAAALLDLLLKQQAGSLIIDQPEDDLDNRIVMDVASLLHSSKMGRQLIFATHNANFVVNGDADKVISLASGSAGGEDPDQKPRVRVETDGAIDVPAVKKAITDTLEGGEEAFDLRGRKYQFDWN